jgi:hypothetical protein
MSHNVPAVYDVLTARQIRKRTLHFNGGQNVAAKLNHLAFAQYNIRSP